MPNLNSFPVEFTKDGEIFNGTQLDNVLNAVNGFTDVVLLSHGWNNDMADAQSLYQDLMANMDKVLPNIPKLQGRSLGFIQVFWPSKRFTDEDLIPGGGAVGATNENQTALLRLLEELKREPKKLGDNSRPQVRVKNIDDAKALVPRLAQDAQARKEFVLYLRTILSPSYAHEDDGSEEFFTRDPEQLFNAFAQPVLAPVADGAGGAASVQGGAAGLGDLLSGFIGAARRIANFTTYYEMKERAGLVGRTGVASLLRQIRQKNSHVKLHLAGHSFGGRLVTAAANALDSNTPNISISLLQAAYSHNGLAQNFDNKGNDGFFRKVISEKRASGPIIITYTKNDKAVGVAYPLASRIANTPAAALGDRNDPYGGMGRNGAQNTAEVNTASAELLPSDGQYSFNSDSVYNLLADNFIKNHGDVAGEQVAYAILCAAATL